MSHTLTEREVFAFELERIWSTLGNLIEHGRTCGRVAEGTPLRLPSKLIARAILLRKQLRELAIDAAPDLGVCRARPVDVDAVAGGAPREYEAVAGTPRIVALAEMRAGSAASGRQGGAYG